jgi:hypothetical protein
MNKKEFKELQKRYLQLNKELEKLNKIYKHQIKPFEEEFFASSMDDEEIDKLVKKDMEIRKNLHIDELETELIKIKDKLITAGGEYILKIAPPEEKNTIEYLLKNYKYNIEITDKIANIFAIMQV